MGRIHALYIGQKDQPLESVDSVRAVAGQGLEGDRYAVNQGTFSSLPGNGRHVTLVELEALEALPEFCRISAQQSRRNIITTGQSLNELVGHEFQVGAVKLLGCRFCEPCEFLAKQTHKGILKAMLGRGGLRAEILSSGTLRRGDDIRCAGLEWSAPSFRYVGPKAIHESLAHSPTACRIRCSEDIEAWMRRHPDEREPSGLVTVTFVVTRLGHLRIANRRSEHVACAQASSVLAAGELVLERVEGRCLVLEASNQSTGFCPDLGSFSALKRALDEAGLDAPEAWTRAVVFRLCEACGQRSIVKDGDFECADCQGALPRHYNF